MIKQLVKVVEIWLLIAIEVVPPVADEILLAKYRAVRTEECGGVPTRAAHMEGLAVRFGVRVDAGRLLGRAVERRVGNGRVNLP